MIIANLHLYRSKWVKINGTKYSTSSVFAVAVEDELPAFGKINRIFVIGKDVTFEINCLYTESYDPHYHAYMVTDTKIKQFIRHDSLLCFYPLTLNKVQNRVGVYMVVLKYHLILHS